VLFFFRIPQRGAVGKGLAIVKLARMPQSAGAHVRCGNSPQALARNENRAARAARETQHDPFVMPGRSPSKTGVNALMGHSRLPRRAGET
jgi:hypothetical protein